MGGGGGERVAAVGRCLMKVKGYTNGVYELVSVSVATIMDNQPTDELVKVYDLADRATEFWKQQAAMVQLCKDAGFGSWKELRGLKPEELEKWTVKAVVELARRERKLEAERQVREGVVQPSGWVLKPLQMAAVTPSRESR